MDFSILINWTSPFLVLGVSGVLFHFYSILNRNSCKQMVKTLIRHQVLQPLIWVYTLCVGPKKRNARLLWVNFHILQMQGHFVAINFRISRFSLIRYNGHKNFATIYFHVHFCLPHIRKINRSRN